MWVDEDSEDKGCVVSSSANLKPSSVSHIYRMAAAAAAAAAKLLQSCPTLCDAIGGSPPGSPVLGILQARILEWVAISFPNAWKWKGKVKSLSPVWLFATPWTAAYQAPPSMGFSRQGYWSGVPLPSPTGWQHISNKWMSVKFHAMDFWSTPIMFCALSRSWVLCMCTLSCVWPYGL